MGRCASSLLQPAVVTLGDLPQRRGKIIASATVRGKWISLAGCIHRPSFHCVLAPWEYSKGPSSALSLSSCQNLLNYD